MRVFILNGPPGIGKDTLAAGIKNYFGWPTLMFKSALYEETAKYFGMDTKQFIQLANDREYKELFCNNLDGFSPRGALIHVSESIIKPTHGKKFFGLKAYEHIQSLDGTTGTVVFSDGGFDEECECLVESGCEVHIIQMHHKNFTFAGDSRNYVSVPGATVHLLHMHRGQAALDVSYFIDIVEKIDQ